MAKDNILVFRFVSSNNEKFVPVAVSVHFPTSVVSFMVLVVSEFVYLLCTGMTLLC